MSKLVTIDCPQCQLLLSYSPSSPVFGCPRCRTIIEADTLFLDLDSLSNNQSNKQSNNLSSNASNSLSGNIANNQSINRAITQALSNNQPKNFSDERLKNACPSVPLIDINQSVNRSITQAITQAKIPKQQKPSRAQLEAISRSITQSIIQSPQLALTHTIESQSHSHSNEQDINLLINQFIEPSSAVAAQLQSFPSGSRSVSQSYKKSTASQLSNKSSVQSVNPPALPTLLINLPPSGTINQISQNFPNQSVSFQLTSHSVSPHLKQPFLTFQSISPSSKQIELCTKCDMDDLESVASVFCDNCSDWLCDDHARLHQRKADKLVLNRTISQTMGNMSDQRLDRNPDNPSDIQPPSHVTQSVSAVRSNVELYRSVRLKQNCLPTCLCDKHQSASQSHGQSVNQSSSHSNGHSYQQQHGKKKSQKHNHSQSSQSNSRSTLPIQLTRLEQYCLDCQQFVCKICTTPALLSVNQSNSVLSNQPIAQPPGNLIDHTGHRLQLVANYFDQSSNESNQVIERSVRTKSQLDRRARVIEKHNRSVNHLISQNESTLTSNVRDTFNRFDQTVDQMMYQRTIFSQQVRPHFDDKRLVKQTKLQSVLAVNESINRTANRVKLRIAKMDFNRIKQSTNQLNQLIDDSLNDPVIQELSNEGKHQRRSSIKSVKQQSYQSSPNPMRNQIMSDGVVKLDECALMLARSVNQMVAYTMHWRSVLYQQVINQSIIHPVDTSAHPSTSISVVDQHEVNQSAERLTNQRILFDDIEEGFEITWDSLIDRIKLINVAIQIATARRILPVDNESAMYSFANQSIKTIPVFFFNSSLHWSINNLLDDLLYVSGDPNGHAVELSIVDWLEITQFIARLINLRQMLQNRGILIDQLIPSSPSLANNPLLNQPSNLPAKKSGLKNAVQRAIQHGQQYRVAYDSFYQLVNLSIQQYSPAEQSMFIQLCDLSVNLLIYHRPSDLHSEYESPTDELALREMLDSCMEIISQYDHAINQTKLRNSQSNKSKQSSNQPLSPVINPVSPLMYQAASRLAWAITGNQMQLSSLTHQSNSPANNQSNNQSDKQVVTNLRCLSFCERCEPVEQLTRLFKNNPSINQSINHLLIDGLNDQSTQLLTKNMKYLTQLKELRLTFLSNLSLKSFNQFCENLKFLFNLTRLDLDVSETSIKLSSTQPIAQSNNQSINQAVNQAVTQSNNPLFKHCKNLQHLNLSDNCLSGSVLNDVMQSIKESSSQSLKHLVLRACEIDDDGFASFASTIHSSNQSLNQLTHLDLANNSPFDYNDQAIKQAVDPSVKMSSHQYTGPGTLRFLSSINQLTYLQSLNLETCGIDASGCCILAGALIDCPMLESINLFGNQLIDQDATLDTSQNRLHNTQLPAPLYGGFQQLCQTLKRLINLQLINFSCCLLDRDACSMLIEALQFLPKLNTLELEYCCGDFGRVRSSLDRQSDDQIYDLLALPSVTKLNLYGSHSFFFDSTCFPRLRSLDVSHMTTEEDSYFELRLSDPSLLHSLYVAGLTPDYSSFFKWLGSSRCLQCLDLSDMSLTGLHCEQLALLLQSLPELLEFDVSGNALDEGCLVLVGSLHFCGHLQKLSMCGVGMNAYAAIKLAEYFPRNPMLRSLDLSDNEIGSFGCVAVGRSIHFLAGLTCLRLSGCALTDEACASLMANLHKLRVLREIDLQDNNFGQWMTASVRELVKRQFPEIDCLLDKEDLTM